MPYLQIHAADVRTVTDADIAQHFLTVPTSNIECAADRLALCDTLKFTFGIRATFAADVALQKFGYHLVMDANPLDPTSGIPIYTVDGAAVVASPSDNLNAVSVEIKVGLDGRFWQALTGAAVPSGINGGATDSGSLTVQLPAAEPGGLGDASASLVIDRTVRHTFCLVGQWQIAPGAGTNVLTVPYFAMEWLQGENGNTAAA